MKQTSKQDRTTTRFVIESFFLISITTEFILFRAKYYALERTPNNSIRSFFYKSDNRILILLEKIASQ